MSQEQPNNPLHGVKLADILSHLVDKIGWDRMSDEIPVRCFQYDPSIKSSLVFLRKTPWARERIEALYLETIKKSKSEPTEKDSHGKYNVRRKS